MYTITGLVLAVVIPTGVTSMIWVSIYSGNAVLALAIVIIDTIYHHLLYHLVLVYLPEAQ